LKKWWKQPDGWDVFLERITVGSRAVASAGRREENQAAPAGAENQVFVMNSQSSKTLPIMKKPLRNPLSFARSGGKGVGDGRELAPLRVFSSHSPFSLAILQVTANSTVTRSG